MSEEINTPFDQPYVMKVTVNKMKKAIDTSFYKTSSRLEEFEEKSDKWIEVLNTLHALHAVRRVIDDFEEHNKHIFNTNKNEEV
jgi:queuine/archaeosine tRNA-ribosyltransferase